jgi:hypothetical protein
LLLLVLLPTFLFGQGDINVSVSNYLRYGTGMDGFLNARRDYFENLAEAKISVSDFLVGFRLLHDAPPEYGMEFTGIKKRYIEFSRDGLYLRAGDSFSLYGRGLALNLFENRGLAFDTGLDGIKLDYKTRVLKASVTGGRIRYADVIDLSRIEQYDLRAGSVELVPYPFFSLGVNYVNGKYRALSAFPDRYSQFDIPEYFGRVQIYDVDMYLSYAEKRTTVFEPDPIFGRIPTHRGTGFYGSLSYTDESFGVALEYKDYRFGITDPDDRTNVNRATKAFAFQNAPIVHKEHAFTLLTRYPHVIDFNDEVGYQVDVFYTLFGRWTGNLNASLSSRHYAFTPTGDTNQIFRPVYASMPRSNSFLPTTDAKFSPFWELYADVQYYFEEGGTDYAEIAVNRRSEEIADELFFTPTGPLIESIRSTAVPFAVQYTLGAFVWKLDVERQWVYEEKNPAQPRFFNQLMSLGLSHSPDYAVTVRYEFTSDKGTVDGRKNWAALDFAFRLSNNHRITLTAGQDRGGQICANGVCRVVNPYRGFRASIVSYL